MSPRALVANLRASPLGIALAISAAAVTVLVVGVNFVVLRSRVQSDVRQVFTQELAASQAGLQRIQQRDLRLLLETSALVSTSPTLRAAILTWRTEATAGLPPRPDLIATIQREVARIHADLDRDLLLVTDEQGRVLAAAGADAPLMGEDLSRFPAIRHALGAETVVPDSVFGVLRRGPVPLQVGCVPIILGGFPTGALLLGDRLDSVIAPLSDGTPTRAVITAGDTVLASTLPLLPAGSRWRDPGDDWIEAVLPLGRADDGAAASMHLLRSISGSLAPITRSTTRSFLLAALLAVIVVGGGAAALTFSLARDRARLREQIAERERAERALKTSEEALRQSQKLESLGTLAGGVAHDFNNLLSVMIGYAHLAGEELPPGSPARADIEEIERAAERATGLVRQLLAFSRKQVLQPQVVDLNRIVTGMTGMLRRLVGEDLSLVTKLEPRLSRITADPGQIEQVLMNLVVNARDAMPHGGTVTIETANVVLDEQYENRPEAIAGGPAAMLAVTDTGVGMDAATRSRIFEPFFTTKEAGKGTGLGLSTVYGIVRQSEGSITVYSEPGKGSTFRCYFPVVADRQGAEPSGERLVDRSVGSETILVAEDEPQLRALVKRTLRSRGYQVIEACHGEEAVEVGLRHPGAIHLLVTDVVMPHLSGKQVAEQLLAKRPDMKVLFISGYSDEAIEKHGVLQPGTVFLQKPVVPDKLAAMARELLDGANV